MFNYQDNKSIITASYYKRDKLMMTSLKIMQISFLWFKKNEVDQSHVRSYVWSNAQLYNYIYCDYSVLY